MLNALRAHDSRVDIFIEEIKLHGDGKRGEKLIGGEEHIIINAAQNVQLKLQSEELQGAICARMAGGRYWERWAADIAQIAERHKKEIQKLADKAEFKNFLADLRRDINPTISTADAVEMLAQHLITRPVFDALFENYSFAQNNVVSKSMQKIFALLDTADDSEQLEKFYQSVRERCRIATTAEDKQKIIIELYDKFFRTALPLTAERLVNRLYAGRSRRFHSALGGRGAEEKFWTRLDGQEYPRARSVHRHGNIPHAADSIGFDSAKRPPAQISERTHAN